MKNYSLSRRVLLIAMVLVTCFLIAIAGVLKATFEKSVLQSAKAALRSQVLILLSDIELETDESLFVPDQLAEPRLGQIDSGLYAEVSRISKDNEQEVIWRSTSLLGAALGDNNALAEVGEFSFTQAASPLGGDSVYRMDLLTEWELETDSAGVYIQVPILVTIAETDLPYQERVKLFQNQLYLYFAGLGLALLLLQFFLLRWSLKPLKRVEHEINQVEAGELSRLQEDYPEEVARLSSSVNNLLEHEERRIEHQKNILGNLAHSLKTPLAVLKGLLFVEQDQHSGKEQIERIQGIIDYQLQQASTLGRRQFAKPYRVYQSAEQIVNSIGKVYAEKHLKIELDCQPAVYFVGDQGDFMEVLGNLAENAAKWAESRIIIRLQNRVSESSNRSANRDMLQIDVIDDGAGIDSEQRDNILNRGIRLDEYTAGHGLGLHIVKSIVLAYQGDLQILESDQEAMKGAHFRVVI